MLERTATSPSVPAVKQDRKGGVLGTRKCAADQGAASTIPKANYLKNENETVQNKSRVQKIKP